MSSPYSDLDRPPLREAELRRALLRGPGTWTGLRVVAETASTNADAAAVARDGAPTGLVIVADRQSAGRGRLDRAWVSPPRSGLTFSVLVRPEGVPLGRWAWLSLLAGLAVAEEVTRLGEVETRLKWPNDVLVGERKLAGVLAERAGDACVIGVGVNVSLRPDELPVPWATSLAIEGSPLVDRGPLLLAVLRRLAVRYERFVTAAGDPEGSGLRDEYRSACDTLGRRVRVELPGGRGLAGTAVDVDAEGRLVVRTDAGEEAVGAGDVVHVR